MFERFKLEVPMKGQIEILLAVLFAVVASGTRAAADDFPSINTVLKHVREAAKQEQANERNFRTRYAFVRTKTNRELDGKGRVKKEETKRNQNNPVVSRTSYVTPSTKVATPAIGPATPPPKNPNQAFDQSDFALTDDLFSRFDFTIVRREQMNARSTLLITFQPAKEPPPVRTLKDRFLSKTAGRVWVDEGDWNLAKADIHLMEKVNVVGGLVGAVKGFNYRFDRQRTEEGLWYTRAVHWRLEGRELFSSKVLECDENRSDVKRVR